MIRRVRVYVSATNLLTVSGFSGIDPELGLSTYNYTGIEKNDNYYPRTRSFTFGLNADF
jgi:iron complex outermembrane receptor protein